MSATSDVPTTVQTPVGNLRRARRQKFIVETFVGADEALAALEAIRGECTGSAFQSLDWVTALYEDLAPHHQASPLVVVATDEMTGAVAVALPLVVCGVRGVRVARFADLGVSDYGAPLIGAACPIELRNLRRMWSAIRRALVMVDVVHLERMSLRARDVQNPFLRLGSLVASQHAGFFIDVPGPIADFVAAQGKKFRKEVERSTRVWQREQPASFRCCASGDDAAHVYATLEEQQASRHADKGKAYVLNEIAYRTFYERIAVDGCQSGLARLFALEANGEIAATLFGIVGGDTFTLLRITTGGEAVSHFSPGRLIVLEAIRYLQAEGVTRFDMGIGDYPFKRSFGAEEANLYDFVSVRTLRGYGYGAGVRLKRRLRQSRLARAVKQRLSLGKK